jgi:hypothetical protein
VKTGSDGSNESARAGQFIVDSSLLIAFKRSVPELDAALLAKLSKFASKNWETSEFCRAALRLPDTLRTGREGFRSALPRRYRLQNMLAVV